MALDTTLRLLSKASGLTVVDIATSIPRAGVSTVNAWLRGEKLPGKDQVDALARTFGVPAGALLSELASTLDPARTKGEHDLLAAYRGLNTKQQGALLEVVREHETESRFEVSKLKRKDYEALLHPLQAELVQMARWVQHSGQRVLVLVEGRDTAGKGGAIQRDPRAPSTRASAGWWRCPSRPSAKPASGTSSATRRTSRRPARSSCSTAAGTTAPAWKR